MAGSPANAPALANAPASNGGSQPAEPASNQNQGTNPLQGGSQLANGSRQPASGGSQPAQNHGASPPSDGTASSGGSLAGQVAQNQGPSPANPVPAALPPPQYILPVANGETLSGAVINSNSIIIAGPSGGVTVQAGAPATQVLGHSIIISPAGSSAVVDGQVQALTMQTGAAINGNSQAPVTPGSSPGNQDLVHQLRSRMLAVKDLLPLPQHYRIQPLSPITSSLISLLPQALSLSMAKRSHIVPPPCSYAILPSHTIPISFLEHRPSPLWSHQ